MNEFLNRFILRNLTYLDYSRTSKKSLTNVALLALYLWIYLKWMTAYLMSTDSLVRDIWFSHE